MFGSIFKWLRGGKWTDAGLEKKRVEFEVIRREGLPTVVVYEEKDRYGERFVRRTSCTRYVREQLEGIEDKRRYDNLTIQYVERHTAVSVNLYIGLRHGILRCHYDGEFCMYVELLGEDRQVILTREDLDDLRWKRRFGHLTGFIDGYYQRIVVAHLMLMADYSEHIKYNAFWQPKRGLS